MKKLAPVVLLLAMACASSVKVNYDYDKTVDFMQYKTYSFTDNALSLPINELNRRRIISAIETELNAKGMQKAERGDVLVDIQVKAEKQQTATATNTGPYGPGYAYRWGGGFSTTRIDVQTYIEGTLFIDLIDEKKKQLVWQGRGTKTLDPEATPEQIDQRIREAVNLIMAKYPPVKK